MPAPRKPRADAERNRERILEAAKLVFTRCGANASLDEIARAAHVGPGTLYRHFPSRQDLLAAVYRTEVEKLAAAGPKLRETLPPLEALRAWMFLFIDQLGTKKIIAPALNNAVIEASYEPVQNTVRALVQGAVEAGEMSPSVNPVDLLRALVGVAYLDSKPDWQASAHRLVDILIGGSRPAS